jgi:hypothetical protein
MAIAVGQSEWRAGGAAFVVEFSGSIKGDVKKKNFSPRQLEWGVSDIQPLCAATKFVSERCGARRVADPWRFSRGRKVWFFPPLILHPVDGGEVMLPLPRSRLLDGTSNHLKTGHVHPYQNPRTQLN